MNSSQKIISLIYQTDYKDKLRLLKEKSPNEYKILIELISNNIRKIINPTINDVTNVIKRTVSNILIKPSEVVDQEISYLFLEESKR
jgi:hypothetical protein